RVLSAADAAPDFHARFSAQSKTYRYRLWRGEVISPFERLYAWHVTGPLDIERMAAAAAMIEGRHDFAVCQASGSSVETTEREISCSRIMMSPTTRATTEDPKDAEDHSRIEDASFKQRSSIDLGVL